MIYRETLKAISLPVPITIPFTSVLHPAHQFYTLSPDNAIASPELLPARTFAEIGARLYSTGVISPSSFGKKADKFAVLLQELVKYSNRENLTPETIRSIIS